MGDGQEGRQQGRRSGGGRGGRRSRGPGGKEKPRRQFLPDLSHGSRLHKAQQAHEPDGGPRVMEQVDVTVPLGTSVIRPQAACRCVHRGHGWHGQAPLPGSSPRFCAQRFP